MWKDFINYKVLHKSDIIITKVACFLREITFLFPPDCWHLVIYIQCRNCIQFQYKNYIQFQSHWNTQHPNCVSQANTEQALNTGLSGTGGFQLGRGDLWDTGNKWDINPKWKAFPRQSNKESHRKSSSYFSMLII